MTRLSTTRLPATRLPATRLPATRTAESGYYFAVISDSHNGGMSYAGADANEAHKTGKLPVALADMKAKGVSFVVHTGDLTGNITDGGEPAAIAAVKVVMDAGGVPYYTAAGNHEHFENYNDTMSYTDTFGASHSSFIFNDDRFIIADNSKEWSGASGDFLDTAYTSAQLSAGTANRNQFLFWHIPYFADAADAPADSGGTKWIVGQYNSDNKSACATVIAQAV